MDGAQTPSSPRRRSRRRGLWFLLLMVFGLPALFSAMILPFSPVAALPWVIVSWSIAGVAGYKIWRIDHPGESARSAIGVRVRWLGTAVITVVVVLVLREADPAWLVAGLGLWFLAVVALGIVLTYLARSEARFQARSPSPVPGDEPSRESRAEPAGDGEGGVDPSREG